MKIQFIHAGIERTLAKHPVIQSRLRLNLITKAQAAATPWYLRLGLKGKNKLFKLTAVKKAEVIRQAKDLLKTRTDRPTEFAEFLHARDARRGLTIGQLAEEWFNAGLPFSATRTRTTVAAETIRVNLTRALPWWRDKTATTIKSSTHADYVVWRRQHVREGYNGSRAADLELASLSCLSQWAIKTERLVTNPFEHRERFTDPATVVHCHETMPANDDEFHRVLTFLWNPFPVKKSKKVTLIADPEPQRIIVGAWLCFSALTGLRPGEHTFLQRVPAAKAFPGDLRAAPNGLIYPMPDGTRRMKVQRTKRGQNPAVLVHPALQDFLDHYLVWLDQASRSTEPTQSLFPGISGEGKINSYLRRACATAKVKHMKPHGFGRAYYVRVRRSQGIDDASIGAELGQKGDGALIRSVYGDPMDPVGGNLHDWMPEDGTPAWHNLTQTTIPNIIAL